MMTICKIAKTMIYYGGLLLYSLLLFVSYTFMLVFCTLAWPFQRIICLAETATRRLLKRRGADKYIRMGAYKNAWQ